MPATEVKITAVAFPSVAATVLSAAVFLVVFDSLSVATALPTLGRHFGLTPTELHWVVNAYSLSLAGLLLLGGRVADAWGQRRVLTGSLIALGAASILAGLAQELPTLLVGRVLQGIAGAFALPASLALVGTVFREEPWRSRGWAAIAVSGNTAGVAGALFGGLLTDSLGWRSIFLVTVPACFGAAVVAARVLPPDPSRGSDKHFSALGAVLGTTGLVGVVAGLGAVGSAGPWAPEVVAPLIVGISGMAGFLITQAKSSSPLVPMHVLLSRRLAGGCAGIAAHSISYSAIVVVGSLYLQDVRDFTATQAGVTLIPALLVGALTGWLGGSLVRKFGSRAVATAGLCLEVGALILLALGTNVALVTLAVVPGFVLHGAGGGPAYVALTKESIGGASEVDRGSASGVFEVATHIGGAVAVATYLSVIAATGSFQFAYLFGAGAVLLCALAVLRLFPARTTSMSEAEARA
jgi:MFS family permease